MHLTDVTCRLLVPVGVSLLVATGTAARVVLATAGGRPAGTAGPYLPVPGTRPAPAGSAQPTVPLLGASADAGRAVPARRSCPWARA